MKSLDRSEALERLHAETFDVLVVGGGITGAGVALDAASRGLRTALVERNDFASGTSSRSSKLVHGGLRYLRQRDYRLVAESLLEQRRLLRNAAHLVRPLPVLLPVGRGQCRRTGVAAVLSMHDLAAGTGVSRSAADGVVFHEAQVDDARLTLAVLQTAALDYGAVVANHVRVVSLEHDATGQVRAAVLSDGHPVPVRWVVNAAGVWSDEVASLDGTGRDGLRPAKGVHVTVPRTRLPLATAMAVPAEDDGRWIMLSPWGDRVVVGTTDTDYDGPLDEPRCTPADVATLLEAVNPFLRDALAPSDVLGSWAGLRPLVADRKRGCTSDVSRRQLVTSRPSGFVTVTGGKLTTYRRMAADAVDRLGCGGLRQCGTVGLRLRGSGARPNGVSEHLWSRYGTEAPQVQASCDGRPELAWPLVPGLPYLAAEAIWAVRSEMARSLDDVMSRRTRATILDRRASARAAPEVARLIGEELGWTAAERNRQVTAYLTLARAAPD